jgi:zinc transport system permease protein
MQPSRLDVIIEALDKAIKSFTLLMPPETYLSFTFNIRGLLAVVLVSLICGAVGSLVVGNRMAFFSDALAHCAFAGVSLGFLLALFGGVQKQSDYYHWITFIMVVFGITVGVAIAYVREKTVLASDTVIGVFFAGAIGFGAMLFTVASSRAYFTPESFLFGDPVAVNAEDLLVLFSLAVVTVGLLAWQYNSLVFTSFNPSLARSRRVPVRLCNYLFVVLLALIVNLCLKTVGALLINALLIVPAATAANICRNMRQLFWTTVGLCLGAGVLGHWLSFEVRLSDAHGKAIAFGAGGTIVVLSVLLFFATMALGPWLRGRQPV